MYLFCRNVDRIYYRKGVIKMPRKKNPISEAEAREYLRLVERANKRITRAGRGQRRALDYILQQTIGQKRFSRTIPTDRRVFN